MSRGRTHNFSVFPDDGCTLLQEMKINTMVSAEYDKRGKASTNLLTNTGSETSS